MKISRPIQLYPFLRIALCLIVGILLGDATANMVVIAMWRWLFVGLLSTSIILYICRRAAIAQTLLVFCVIVIVGAWRVAYHEQQQRCTFSGKEEPFEAVVMAQPVENQRSFKCELTIVSGRMAGHKVYAYFQKPLADASSAKLSALNVGDGIVATSVFSPFDDNERGRGGFDWSRQRMVRGIVARTFVRTDCWQRAEVSTLTMPAFARLSVRLQSLRQCLLRRLRGCGISTSAYATIAAMTLGDKSALTAELREAYSKAGVSHVLALSGLHLGIIYAMLALLLGHRRNTLLGLVSTITLIWLFALMVGMSPGIVRSAAMFTLYASMSYLARDYLTLNSLAAAATMILVASPLMLWDVGFQMSFLAVLGIVIGHTLVRNNRFYVRYSRCRVVGRVVSLVFVSLFAQMFVLPLVMFYFGNVPFYFLLANIVAIPLTTLIIYMSILLFVLSPMCALGALVNEVWQWLFVVVGKLTSWMNGVLAFIATLPGASLQGVYISEVQLLAMYLLIAALLCVWHYSQRMYDAKYGIAKFRSLEAMVKP